MSIIPQRLRPLAARPALAAGIVVILGLGVGLSSAMFGLVRATVIVPRQSFDGNQLFAISVIHKAPWRRSGADLPAPIVTTEKIEQLVRNPPPPFESVLASQMTTVVVRLGDRAERVRGEFLLGDYQNALRLRAGTGRFLAASYTATGAADEVVVSDRLWQTWFVPAGAAPGSATLLIDGRSFRVIGAAPAGFRGVIPFQSVEVWLPASAFAGFNPQLFVRAPSGMSGRAVGEAMRTALGIGPNPESSGGFTVSAMPTNSLLADSLDRVGWIILGFGVLVMLAGSVNAMNLLHVYFAARGREFATRRAIGASAASLAGMCASEIAVLIALATVVGIAVTWGILAAIDQSAPLGLASGRAMLWRSGTMFSVVVDRAVAEYALVSTLVSGAALAAVAIARALRASSGNPLHGAASATAPRSSGRHVMLSVQVAIATVLMLGTATLIGRVMPALDQSSAMNTGGVVASRLDLSLHAYSDPAGREFYERVLTSISKTPGIASVAVADGIPGYSYVSPPTFQIVAEPQPGALSNTPRSFLNGSYAGVSENFFTVMGLGITEGRSVLAADGYGAPLVAVVSQSVAARLWPNGGAVGRRIMFGNDGRWRTVVGVSDDPVHVRNERGVVCRACVVFVPFAQQYNAQMVVVARSTSISRGEALLRGAIAQQDSAVIPFDLGPLDATLLRAFWRERSAALLVAATGLVALLIAALGIFSATAYVVNLRAFEIAVRMALGATPQRVVGLVLQDVRLVTLIGLLAGVTIMAFSERGFAAMIKGFMPNDLWTWAAVLVSVPAVTIGAGYVPARRSSRVSPAQLQRGRDS